MKSLSLDPIFQNGIHKADMISAIGGGVFFTVSSVALTVFGILYPHHYLITLPVCGSFATFNLATFTIGLCRLNRKRKRSLLAAAKSSILQVKKEQDQKIDKVAPSKNQTHTQNVPAVDSNHPSYIWIQKCDPLFDSLENLVVSFVAAYNRSEKKTDSEGEIEEIRQAMNAFDKIFKQMLSDPSQILRLALAKIAQISFIDPDWIETIFTPASHSEIKDEKLLCRQFLDDLPSILDEIPKLPSSALSLRNFGKNLFKNLFSMASPEDATTVNFIKSLKAAFAEWLSAKKRWNKVPNEQKEKKKAVAIEFWEKRYALDDILINFLDYLWKIQTASGVLVSPSGLEKLYLEYHFDVLIPELIYELTDALIQGSYSDPFKLFYLALTPIGRTIYINSKVKNWFEQQFFNEPFCTQMTPSSLKLIALLGTPIYAGLLKPNHPLYKKLKDDIGPSLQIPEDLTIEDENRAPAEHFEMRIASLKQFLDNIAKQLDNLQFSQ